MKKLLALLSLTALATAVYAAPQATVVLNNFTPDRPIYIGSEGVYADNDASGNIYIELLGPGGKPVVSPDLGNATMFQLEFGGYFDDGVGVIADVVPGAVAELTLRVWKAAAGSTYDAAFGSAPTALVTWSQATGSWDPASVPPGPAVGPDLAIPASPVMAVVPEPSTLALGALGLVALFLRRRQ